MALPLTSYRVAVAEGRFRDAATDGPLHARWREDRNPLARALLIVAAAHLHAAQGNVPGARAKLERALPYLEAAGDDALAVTLRMHVTRALEVVDRGDGLPPLPIHPDRGTGRPSP